jgi:hypothetical protein
MGSDVFRSDCVAQRQKLITLRDAAEYITELPKAEHDTAEWQAAMQALLLVVEHNGPTIFARIGIMRALNRNVVREFDSSRKDTSKTRIWTSSVPMGSRPADTAVALALAIE